MLYLDCFASDSLAGAQFPQHPGLSEAGGAGGGFLSQSFVSLKQLSEPLLCLCAKGPRFYIGGQGAVAQVFGG